MNMNRIWRHKNMNSELEALRNAFVKAVQTTANQPNSMGITYDEEIQWKTFQYAPFLTYLESKGRCTDVSTANVAFYKETPANTAQFIAESADIPDYTATSYEEVPDRMKTLVSGIKVSKMAEMGTDYMDVLAREIERGYLKVENILDETLLAGDKTVDSNSFNKVWKDANSDDLDGAEITEDDIDEMLNTIINENGGHPDVIVTDAYVAKQLRAIVAPYRRYNDKIDIGLGHRVVSYESLDGIEIPIIVDKNLPADTEADEHRLVALDSSTIDVKYLMRPSLVTDLPANNLAYNQAVVTYVTAMNTAPFKNGVISGIGDGE